MNIFLMLFRELPFYPGYFILIMFLSGIYCVLIGPFIYKFFIIPGIEARYNESVKIDERDALVPFSNWGLPVFEIPIYVFFKYIGVETWGMRNPQKWTILYRLKKVNYDMKDAGIGEKIVNVVSLIFLFCLFISSAVFGFYLYSEG